MLPAGPFFINSVLYNDKKRVVDFIRAHYPVWSDVDFGAHEALGVFRRGVLVGGVVYYHYRPHAKSIAICSEFVTPAWCLPNTLTQLLNYPLKQLGCTRITAVTGRKNKRTRQFMERLGAKVEGVARRALDGRQDEIMYGLLVEEITWKDK